MRWNTSILEATVFSVAAGLLGAPACGGSTDDQGTGGAFDGGSSGGSSGMAGTAGQGGAHAGGASSGGSAGTGGAGGALGGTGGLAGEAGDGGFGGDAAGMFDAADDRGGFGGDDDAGAGDSAAGGGAGGVDGGIRCFAVPSGDQYCTGERPPHYYRCVLSEPPDPRCELRSVGDVTDYYCCP
jgi:hypothetical protein